MEASSKSSEMQSIVEDLKTRLLGINPENIRDYNQRLFPILSSSRIYETLYISLYTFYSIKISKLDSVDLITNEAIVLSEEFGSEFKNRIGILLHSEFLDKLMGKIINSRKSTLGETNASEDKGKTIRKQEKSRSSLNESIDVDTNNDVQPILLSKQTVTKSRSKNERVKSINESGETETIQNIGLSGRCICGQQALPTADTFSCLSCGKEYHLTCMNLTDKNRYCNMCHLRQIAPNKPVKKTLFMGVLSKNKKRHTFSIHLSEQDIKSKYLIQVRCFRLKQGTGSFILFPDYFKLTVGKQTLKELLPIHKQSSLKYRKDQSFILNNKECFTNKTKIIISEKPQSATSKTDRIEVQNHLLGVFLIQQQSIDTTFQECLLSSVSTFEEAEKILLSAFQPSGQQQLEDLLLLVVKIPLTCTLSTERLKYPARGIYCTHNQCFDLYNFLVLTSLSTNPRWTCPFCRLPCFAFKIDCILLAILELNKDKKDVKEMMLFKTGEYTLSSNSNEAHLSVHSIYNLDVATQLKRPSISPQQVPQKRRAMIIEQIE